MLNTLAGTDGRTRTETELFDALSDLACSEFAALKVERLQQRLENAYRRPRKPAVFHSSWALATFLALERRYEERTAPNPSPEHLRKRARKEALAFADLAHLGPSESVTVRLPVSTGAAADLDGTYEISVHRHGRTAGYEMRKISDEIL